MIINISIGIILGLLLHRFIINFLQNRENIFRNYRQCCDYIQVISRKHCKPTNYYCKHEYAKNKKENIEYSLSYPYAPFCNKRKKFLSEIVNNYETFECEYHKVRFYLIRFKVFEFIKYTFNILIKEIK